MLGTVRVAVSGATQLSSDHAGAASTTLRPGDTLTLRRSQKVKVKVSDTGSGSDSGDDSYAYEVQYGYSDDDGIDDDAVHQVTSTGQPTVLYFPEQVSAVRLSVTVEGSSSVVPTEVVSVAVDPFPIHDQLFGSLAKFRVSGFRDAGGRECKDGKIVGSDDSCVSVPSETCTDTHCCRGLVCMVMPSGPNRCRITGVPGFGWASPTPNPPAGIEEPVSSAGALAEQVSTSVVVGIALAVAAFLVLIGIIFVRMYKSEDDLNSHNTKVLLDLDDDNTTIYASESGWESTRYASRHQSRLETGRSSTGYSGYSISSGMPLNGPPARRVGMPDEHGRASKFQWKHSSNGDTV